MSKMQGFRKAVASKTRQLWDDVANSDTLQTLRHSGLFGAQGKNPWVDKLDDLAAATAKKQDDRLSSRVSRMFDLSGLDEHASKNLMQEAKETIKGSGMFGEGGAALKDLAGRYSVPEPGIARKVVEQVRGATGDVVGSINPLKLVAGSDQSRTQLMHDLWEGGLIGKGSPLHKAVMPGEALGKNYQKYKNILLGQETMPSLKEIGKDALATTGAVAKPLLIGGSIFPAASIASRITSPESYDEGVLRGSLRDAGWYAGTTLGVPLGLAGITAGSAAGQSIGDALGAGLEKGFGSSKKRTQYAIRGALEGLG